MLTVGALFKMIEKLKQTHRRYRLRKEVLTFEEAIWLAIGIITGYLIAKGFSILLLILVIAIFAAFVYEEHYARKHGLFNIFGERMR